jgi:hypothetical protein
MPDPWVVAECERLREWLLLWMDDEARERYRRIADQYFMLGAAGDKSLRTCAFLAETRCPSFAPFVRCARYDAFTQLRHVIVRPSCVPPAARAARSRRNAPQTLRLPSATPPRSYELAILTLGLRGFRSK